MHPQTGMSQTACATVQGHLVHYDEVVFQGVPKWGERTGRYLAVAANPSPLPKSMNAVVHLATKDAVDSP